MSEVASIHQLAAVGAWNIADLWPAFLNRLFFADEEENGCSFFAIGADIFECLDIGPHSVAAFAMTKLGLLDIEPHKLNMAPRAFSHRLHVGCFGNSRLGSTVSAKLAAKKHKAEAFWTSNGFQPRSTKLALWFVAFDTGSAVWTIQSFNFHSISYARLSTSLPRRRRGRSIDRIDVLLAQGTFQSR